MAEYNCPHNYVIGLECYCASPYHTCQPGTICHDQQCLPVCARGYDRECACGSRTYGSTAFSVCQAGQYCDIATGTCENCVFGQSDACKCGNSFAGHCQTCYNALNTTYCATCLAGYYLNDSNDCVACLQKNCAECDSGNKCMNCLEGFYMMNGVCMPYPAGCAKINDAGKCIECENNSFKEGQPGIDLKCYKCDYSCEGCVKGRPDACIACAQNAVPVNALSPKKCRVLACAEADWDKSTCATCGWRYYMTDYVYGAFSNCKMCPATPFIEQMEEFANFSACYCGAGYENCGSCDQDGGCLFCKSGYRVGYNYNSCDICAEGFAEVDVFGKLVCSGCKDGYFASKVARGNGVERTVECSACTADLNVQNQDCVCNYIANCYLCDVHNGVCAQCRFGYDGDRCEKCRDGYVMTDGACTAMCTFDYLRDNEYCGVTVAPASCPQDIVSIQQMRTPCKCGGARNCANCADEGCGMCLVGYKYRNGSCTQCNDGYWLKGMQCFKCPATGEQADPQFEQCVCGTQNGCRTCRDDKMCLECIDGYEFQNGQCAHILKTDYTNVIVGCVAGFMGVIGIVALLIYCVKLQRKDYVKIEEAVE